MEELKSHFANPIGRLLKMRKSLGYETNFHLQTLKRFDAFAIARHPDANEITRSLVEEFVLNEQLEGRKGIREKLHAIRNLGTFICSTGGKAFVVPMSMIPKPRKFNPHVFTDEELALLFRQIDEMPVGKSFDPMVNRFAPVLFRLIYTCGLRPGEAYRLQRRNVDLSTGEIKIEKTKNKRDRVVVMSDEMRSLLASYMEYLQIKHPSAEFLFCDSNGRKCKTGLFNRFFRKVWRRTCEESGIKSSMQARAYDLRHRFASRVLCGWAAEGLDLFSRLPILRAYMGHAALSSTMYYVHLLPKALLTSSAIDWNRLNAILPEE